MTTIAKEINLAKLNEFDGTKEYAHCFLSSCETYLCVNKHIYNTDELKINFVLSFMQTKSAGDWAINHESLTSTFMVDSKGNKLTTIVSYSTWTNFINDFKNTFITTDDANEAQQALLKLKQTGTVDDFNNQFQSLVTQSGISSPEALITLYQARLTLGLLKNIYNCDVMPSTIEDWYKVASCSDNIYQHLWAIQGPPPSNLQTNHFCKPPIITISTPDNVALQICQLINSLSDNQKEELFNKMDKQDF
ncbi:hypothetical protein M0805_001062 [Coniferiporia weirii]|nr:hypothetical protein M0805_001062 [Coniferiporia weirii]